MSPVAAGLVGSVQLSTLRCHAAEMPAKEIYKQTSIHQTGGLLCIVGVKEERLKLRACEHDQVWK